MTDDAVNFINERFGGFNREPLNLFESCFDVDMMVACCLSASDVKNFGKKAFDSLCQHFAELFTVEEVGAMKKEYKELKGHVIKMKKTQQWMKPINIFAGVIGNAEALGFLNISIMLELMFVITPSTAHIERSFHAMNSIKTKLRNGLIQIFSSICGSRKQTSQLLQKKFFNFGVK